MDIDIIHKYLFDKTGLGWQWLDSSDGIIYYISVVNKENVLDILTKVGITYEIIPQTFNNRVYITESDIIACIRDNKIDNILDES